MNDAQLSEQQLKVDSGESVQPVVEQVVVEGATTTTDESTQENAANQQATSSTTQKLTVEQQQAEELRLKYPMPQKPGSNFIKKMLYRVNI